MKKAWQFLSKKTILDSRWLRVDQEECLLPNGKVIDDFYTMSQPDWVLILARTNEDKWIIESQYRHGTQKVSLEFPAGIINEGETPIEAAKRELQEEVAYGEGKWSFLGEFPMNPDRHRGRFFVVFADGVISKGTTCFDDTEEIDLSLLSQSELEEKIKTGEFNHPHQLAAFYVWQLKQL